MVALRGAEAVDVHRVETGVPGGSYVALTVAREDAVVVVGDAERLFGISDGRGRGVRLSADIVGTTDGDVEPVADVEVVEDRVGEELVTVSD